MSTVYVHERYRVQEYLLYERTKMRKIPVVGTRTYRTVHVRGLQYYWERKTRESVPCVVHNARREIRYHIFLDVRIDSR
jgi:hypothetical protein